MEQKTKVNLKENNGITLIALVVTIIVLIILAGVSINLLFGENGIITRARLSKERHEISSYIDRIELSRGTVLVNNNGEVTLDNLIEQIYKDKIVEEGSIQKLDDYRAKLMTKEGYIFTIEAEKTEYVSKGKVEKLPQESDESLSISEAIWNEETHTATVTISKGKKVSENLKIQYQINGQDSRQWKDGEKIEGLNLNDIVYARLWNGVEGGANTERKIEDEVDPIAEIILSQTNATIETSITATVELKDKESGIDLENCGWTYNDEKEIGTEEISKYENTFESEQEELTLQKTEAGTYYLHVLVQDKAGRKIEKVTEEITVTSGAVVTYHIDENNTQTEQIITGHNCAKPTTFTPEKNGYKFVGWRTDKTANEIVESSIIMKTDPISLYAVFKKDVKLTTYNNTTQATTEVKQQYYNNGTISNPTFTVNQTTKTGWNNRGWSNDGSIGNAEVTTSEINNLALSNDTTLYGLYEKDVTVSYNANTGTGTTAAETKKAYYNSNDKTSNPTFTLRSSGFSKSNYTFLNWAEDSVTSSTRKNAGSNVTLSDSKTYYAKWQHKHVGQDATASPNGCYQKAEQYGGSCPGHYNYRYECTVCGSNVGWLFGACSNPACGNTGQKNRAVETSSYTHNSASECSEWKYNTRYRLSCTLPTEV